LEIDQYKVTLKLWQKVYESSKNALRKKIELAS
jgi:hypothetical protein